MSMLFHSLQSKLKLCVFTSKTSCISLQNNTDKQTNISVNSVIVGEVKRKLT